MLYNNNYCYYYDDDDDDVISRRYDWHLVKMETWRAPS